MSNPYATARASGIVLVLQERRVKRTAAKPEAKVEEAKAPAKRQVRRL
jgi:hypothetical protein